MARYMYTAAEANKAAKELMSLIENMPIDLSSERRQESMALVACGIARMVNYGMRCCPRPPQSTVRLNAVRKAVEGLPVSVTMETRTDEETGRTYHVLLTSPLFEGKVNR